MKTRILLFLSLVVAALGIAGPAAAQRESAAVTNYKQAVERELSTWAANVRDANETISKAAADLDALKKQSPKPADYDQRLKGIETRIKNGQAQIEMATENARVSIGLLEVPFSKSDDTKPIVAFVQEVIKQKGIPLSKNFIVTPQATWNWKSNSLGSVGIKVRFQSKYF